MIAEEAANVGVGGPALFDRGQDGREVVVEQHQVRGLARDVCAAPHPSPPPDVGLSQGGPVVDSVAGHRDDMSAVLQAFATRNFCSGGETRLITMPSRSSMAPSI